MLYANKTLTKHKVGTYGSRLLFSLNKGREYDARTPGNTVLACRLILTGRLSQESRVVIPVKPVRFYDDVVSATDAVPRRAVESEFPNNRHVRRAQPRKRLFHSVTFIDARFSMCTCRNLRRTHSTYETVSATRCYWVVAVSTGPTCAAPFLLLHVLGCLLSVWMRWWLTGRGPPLQRRSVFFFVFFAHSQNYTLVFSWKTRRFLGIWYKK
jgi:hypothetical protein